MAEKTELSTPVHTHCYRPPESMYDLIRMPRELTAENGAKALLIGEFTETVKNPAYCGCGEEFCDACEVESDYKYLTVPVSWTTIKAIYKMAAEHLAR